MTFLSHLDNHSWPDRIRRFRHSIVRTPFAVGSDEDRAEMMREVDMKNPVVVITDSPEVDEDYLANLTCRVPLVISLDDTAACRFPSDLVINPTLGHGMDEYALFSQTQLLAGARYMMVRSEFRRARNVRATEPSKPTRVLISLGGGEVGEATLSYARALLARKEIEVVEAILGAGDKVTPEFEALSEEFSGRLQIATDVRDLATRMSKAHLLVSGGGNTAMEAGCVGIPMVVVAQNPRHELNAARLEDIGVAQYLGCVESVEAGHVAETAVSILEDNFERRAMSRSGRMLIDGRGADRIVTATEILLRRAKRRSARAMAA